MKTQTEYISVIRLINTPINTKISLKKNFILLLCVYFPFFSFVCQSQEVDLHSCSSGKFTQFFYPSGKVSSEGCLENGSAEGIWVSFYENGSLKSKGEYVKNELNGKWSFYYENSQLQKEIVYLNHRKNGVEINYSEEGVIITSTTWESDVKNGEEIRYFESGEIQHVTYFTEGKKDGKCRQYAIDGRIITFKTYKKGVIFSTERFNRFDSQGEKTGVWKEFFESLVVSEEGPYAGGKKHGVFRTYDKRGNLINLVKYEFGEVVVDEEILDPTEVIRLYHPNGQCSEETVYRNGIKHGVFREFNTSGEIVSGGVYSDGVLLESGIIDKSGKKQGKWIIYYKSGEVKAEGNYVDDLREGEWIFYYESGPVEQRGFYKKGEYDDVWVWSFKNGDKKRFEQYIKGVEHGDFLEYDSLGNVLLKGNYKNGLREWNWIYHVNDHKEEGFYISGQKDGEWVHTYSDGTVIFRGSFSFGEPEGLHRVWSAEGIIVSSGKYKEGVKHGKWKFYDSEGVIKNIYKYKHGELIKVDGRKVQESKQS